MAYSTNTSKLFVYFIKLNNRLILISKVNVYWEKFSTCYLTEKTRKLFAFFNNWWNIKNVQCKWPIKKKKVRQNEIVINTFNGTCKHGNCYLQFNPTLDARYEKSWKCPYLLLLLLPKNTWLFSQLQKNLVCTAKNEDYLVWFLSSDNYYLNRED